MYFLSDIATFARKEKQPKEPKVKKIRATKVEKPKRVSRRQAMTAADRDRMDPFKNTRRAITSGATISREIRSWLRLPGQIRTNFMPGSKKKNP